MSATYRIEREWANFASHIFSKESPPSTIQYDETRKAFIAGFISMFGIATQKIGNNLSVADSVKLLEELGDEILEIGQTWIRQADEYKKRAASSRN